MGLLLKLAQAIDGAAAMEVAIKFESLYLYRTLK